MAAAMGDFYVQEGGGQGKTFTAEVPQMTSGRLGHYRIITVYHNAVHVGCLHYGKLRLHA